MTKRQIKPTNPIFKTILLYAQYFYFLTSWLQAPFLERQASAIIGADESYGNMWCNDPDFIAPSVTCNNNFKLSQKKRPLCESSFENTDEIPFPKKARVEQKSLTQQEVPSLQSDTFQASSDASFSNSEAEEVATSEKEENGPCNKQRNFLALQHPITTIRNDTYPELPQGSLELLWIVIQNLFGDRDAAQRRDFFLFLYKISSQKAEDDFPEVFFRTGLLLAKLSKPAPEFVENLIKEKIANYICYADYDDEITKPEEKFLLEIKKLCHALEQIKCFLQNKLTGTEAINVGLLLDSYFQEFLYRVEDIFSSNEKDCARTLEMAQSKGLGFLENMSEVAELNYPYETRREKIASYLQNLLSTLKV